jgi:hypothetical protein
VSQEDGSIRLKDGQVLRCGEDFLHEVGWFNHHGKMFGRGDLSKEDLREVARTLPAEHLIAFLPMGETANFCKIRDSQGLKTPESQRRKEEHLDEIFLEKTAFALMSGKVFVIDRKGRFPYRELVHLYGMEFHVLTPEAFTELVMELRKKSPSPK